MEADQYRVFQANYRPTPMGDALYVQFERKDGAIMSFAEVWRLFDELYPGKWALQVFPPRGQFIDQANKYHLWILDSVPRNMNLATDHDYKGWREPEVRFPLDEPGSRS